MRRRRRDVPGYADDETVGIEEQLGKTIPLHLSFNDEEGKPVTLGELIDKPTILTLVYFRCPSICSPLMHDLAATLDAMKLVAGVDYELLTVSFDHRGGRTTIARQRRSNNLLAQRMKSRRSPPRCLALPHR